MRIGTLLFALGALAGALVPATSFAAPIEYVKVCSVYGAYYYYAPGSDSCVNAITGEVKTAFSGGTINRQTYVVARVRALESVFCDGCFAIVGLGGGLIQSEQAKSSSRLAAGRYQVLFKETVNGCALNATLGNPVGDGAQQPPGMVSVGRAPGTDNKGVLVWTYNPTGTLSDRAFHLSLACKHKDPFCTVNGSNGTHVCTGSENVHDLGPPGP